MGSPEFWTTQPFANAYKKWNFKQKRSGNPKATRPTLAENLDKMRDFKACEE